nr:MAG TPA: hypothetical protein [Caudoviricetes sp.]
MCRFRTGLFFCLQSSVKILQGPVIIGIDVEN